MTRFAKRLVGLAAVAVLAVMVQLVIFLYSRSEVDTIDRHNHYEEEIISQIDDFYIDYQRGFLIESVDETNVEQLRENILALESNQPVSSRLIGSFNDLYRRFIALDIINGMYQGNVIQGDRVQISVPFIEGLTYQDALQANDSIRFAEPVDLFQETINNQLDYILEQFEAYEITLEELEDVSYIPMADGYYNILARAMAEAELSYQTVNNPVLVAELDSLFQAFAKSFIDHIAQTYSDPASLNIIREAVQPSAYLVKVLETIQ